MSLREVVYRTGRTTRMLEHAIWLAGQGRAVYIAAESSAFAKKLEQQRRDKAAWSTSIKIEPYFDMDINWETMTLRGAHKNCVLLIDHFVIERKFFRMLQMQEQYDLHSTKRMSWDTGGGSLTEEL